MGKKKIKKTVQQPGAIHSTTYTDNLYILHRNRFMIILFFFFCLSIKLHWELFIWEVNQSWQGVFAIGNTLVWACWVAKTAVHLRMVTHWFLCISSALTDLCFFLCVCRRETVSSVEWEMWISMIHYTVCNHYNTGNTRISPVIRTLLILDFKFVKYNEMGRLVKMYMKQY